MNFFSVQKHLLSKLLLLELSVVGSQWQKCEVFISGGGSSPKFARCQSEARLCGVAVLCQTQVAGEPCGRALSAYSGGCQCQVMRISLLPEAKNFFSHHPTLDHSLHRIVCLLVGALTIC